MDKKSDRYDPGGDDYYFKITIASRSLKLGHQSYQWLTGWELRDGFDRARAIWAYGPKYCESHASDTD